MRTYRLPWLAPLLLLFSCKGVEVQPHCERIHRIAFNTSTLPKEKIPSQAKDTTPPRALGSGRVTVARVGLAKVYDVLTIQMINPNGRTDIYVNECWDAGLDEMARAFLIDYLGYALKNDPIKDDDPRYLIEGEIIQMTATESEVQVKLAVKLKTYDGRRETLIWSEDVPGKAAVKKIDNVSYMGVPPAYEEALADIAARILSEIRARDQGLRDARLEAKRAAAVARFKDSVDLAKARNAKAYADKTKARIDAAVNQIELEIARYQMIQARADAARAAAEADKARAEATKAEIEAGLRPGNIPPIKQP